MLQAAQLAINDSQDIEVVLAALFHDIGHLMAFKDSTIETNELGAKDHEKFGAIYIKACGFGDAISNLIENHVKAKKYLAYKDPNYINKLSSASQQTLIEQGGIMNQDQAEQFEQYPDFEMSIKLRNYDEQAKEKDFTTKDLGFFKELARNYLEKSRL